MGRPPLSIGTAGRVRLYPSGSGWRARALYRDYDGVTRPIEKRGNTRGAAERALGEVVRDRAHSSHGSDLTPDTRVAMLVQRWLSDFENQGKALRTVEQYRYAVERSVVPGLGSLRIRELTVATCDRFLRAVEAKHGSPVARTTRSVLSGMCGYAARRDLLERNPVRDTGAITTKPKKAPQALTIEQVRDLRTWLSYDDLAIKRDVPDLVAFMLATGLRISEAAAVRWQDVDLEQRTVAVRGNVVRVKGLGLILQQDESSKLTVRTLVLPQWAIELLIRRYEPKTCPPSCPVFPAAKGGFRDPSNTQADLRAAFNRCGYDWVTSHVMRKTCATLLDEAGLSARAIADVLGHSTPAMTQNRYMGRRLSNEAARVLEALA